MRLSLRNWRGEELDHCPAADGNNAIYEAMMVLARRDSLDIGDILAVDDDNAPALVPDTLMTISAESLGGLASRLECRAAVISHEQPESAADLMTAARFIRRGLACGWVGKTSIAI
jgi:hypothetical protein